MGKGKKQTIGYKHYLGLHAVFCHGPIDRFTHLRWDDRLAWSGDGTGGSITVDAPTLFGGEDREGGVGGRVDIEMGGLTQGKNDYLLSKIGPNIPAYRGVAALVFRDFYWGNNPYLKPVMARGQRIYTAQDGEEQWYPEKAEIGNTGALEPAQKWYARCRVEMLEPTTTFNAAGFRLRPNVGRHIYYTDQGVWPGSQSSEFPSGVPYVEIDSDGHGVTMYWCQPTIMDAREVELMLQFGAFSVGPDMRCRFLWQFWNGDPVYLAPKPKSTIISPNSSSQSEGDPFDVRSLWPDYWYFGVEGAGLIPGGFESGDMNGAHIIRECLTNQDWGMGYPESDIDDDSFTAAADTLYSEGLGISILWDRQAQIEDFIAEIVRHIDAALYVSRRTGKFVLKLIRADYNPAELITLDESNIDKIEAPRRPASGELVTSVTVRFWNKATGRDDTVTVHDPAGVQMQGATITSTLDYKGLTNSATAARVAARDHHALSNPYLSCTVYTGDAGRELEPGDVFKLSWSKWKLQDVVMRVTGYAVAEGSSEQVRLNVTEDVFATPAAPVIDEDEDGWEDPSQPPSPVVDMIAFEVPYYELVQVEGQTNVDEMLGSNPELGFVGAAATRSTNALNAQLWTDGGGGFEEVDTMDFAPTGLLAAPLGKTDTAATLDAATDLDLVAVGGHFQIGDELLRLDSIDLETGAITFGRGVLDTVPQDHPAGARAYFWDEYAGVDATEYADAEEVDVRVVAQSGAGTATLLDAPEQTVTLDQRAIRPYPPGNLTINGDSYLSIAYDGVLTVAWAHRDRLQQTGGELVDHFEGDIGPEAGTTYRVRAYLNGVLDDEQDEIDGTDTTVTPSGSGLVRIEVHAKRDGLYSMQGAAHEFPYFADGTSLALEDEDAALVGEDGDFFATED